MTETYFDETFVNNSKTGYDQFMAMPKGETPLATYAWTLGVIQAAKQLANDLEVSLLYPNIMRNPND